MIRQKYFEILEKVFEIQVVIESISTAGDSERELKYELRKRFEECERTMLEKWLQFREEELTDEERGRRLINKRCWSL